MLPRGGAWDTIGDAGALRREGHLFTRTIFTAAAVLAAGTLAAEAKPRFIGTFLVDTTTAACDSYFPLVGQPIGLRFRPANVGDNGTDSTFNLFDRIGSASHKVAGSLSTVAKAYSGTSIGGNAGTHSGTIKLATVPTVTTTTDFVAFTGTITNFDGMTGCTVGFRAAVVRQLN